MPSPEGCGLFLLESVTIELQRAAVFRHRANNLFRCSGGDFNINLQRNLHIGTNDAGQMRDDFIRNSPGIPTNTF